MAQNIQLFGPRDGFLTHQWIIHGSSHWMIRYSSATIAIYQIGAQLLKTFTEKTRYIYRETVHTNLIKKLKDVITEILKNGEKVVPERNREDHESTDMPRKQQNNGQYEYRAQGNRQHDDNKWRKPGQYEDRPQGSRKLDDYGWGRQGQYEYRAQESRHHHDNGWGETEIL